MRRMWSWREAEVRCRMQGLATPWPDGLRLSKTQAIHLMNWTDAWNSPQHFPKCQRGCPWRGFECQWHRSLVCFQLLQLNVTDWVICQEKYLCCKYFCKSQSMGLQLSHNGIPHSPLRKSICKTQAFQRQPANHYPKGVSPVWDQSLQDQLPLEGSHLQHQPYVILEMKFPKQGIWDTNL